MPIAARRSSESSGSGGAALGNSPSCRLAQNSARARAARARYGLMIRTRPSAGPRQRGTVADSRASIASASEAGSAPGSSPTPASSSSSSAAATPARSSRAENGARSPDCSALRARGASPRWAPSASSRAERARARRRSAGPVAPRRRTRWRGGFSQLAVASLTVVALPRRILRSTQSIASGSRDGSVRRWVSRAATAPSSPAARQSATSDVPTVVSVSGAEASSATGIPSVPSTRARTGPVESGWRRTIAISSAR